MQQRYLNMHDITCREADNENPHIEGYFAVFGDVYEVWPGVTESIAAGAFTESVAQDVRALYNHNTDVVLGRASAGTLHLRQDERGLWGDIEINKEDTEAMNVYRRIKRGDITGCSFGFEIESERWEEKPDGTIHYTIERVNPLYEVSPCAFPAYEATNINARGKDLETIKARTAQAWRDRMTARLNGGKKNAESVNAAAED